MAEDRGADRPAEPGDRWGWPPASSGLLRAYGGASAVVGPGTARDPLLPARGPRTAADRRPRPRAGSRDRADRSASHLGGRETPSPVLPRWH